MEINEANISKGWAKAFIQVSETPGRIITPLVVTINLSDNESDWEDKEIRQYVDGLLKAKPKLWDKSIHTVANTIFPQMMWNRSKSSKEFFDWYRSVLPRVRNCRGNAHGVYFERMAAFEDGSKRVNQLQHVLDTWKKGNHRKSSLQAGIFDPRQDHTHQRMRGFPCLQQIGFIPLGTNGSRGLMVSAYYPTQYIFQKAYGNYLGLCRLGQFMANYMKLKFTTLTCYIGAAEIEADVAGGEAKKIATKLKGMLG